MNVETRFQEQGSLPPPKIIGRVVRLLFGIWLIWAFYSELDVALAFISGHRVMDAVPPQNVTFWFAVLIVFLVFPYVINLGWTKSWKRWPQIIIAGLAAVAVLWGLVLYGAWWSPPLEILLLIWMMYVFGHLGISFLLASLISTPGCEMRAIPHLWTKLSGRATQEHYCPGFLDGLDRWERNAQKSEEN